MASNLICTDTGLWRRDVDSVNCGICKTRFKAAHLNVLPFPFVPLKGDAGQAAHGVGNVCVGNRSKDFVWHDLENVVGGLFAVDGFRFTRDALRRSPGSCWLCEATLHLYIGGRGLAGLDITVFVKVANPK